MMTLNFVEARARHFGHAGNTKNLDNEINSRLTFPTHPPTRQCPLPWASHILSISPQLIPETAESVVLYSEKGTNKSSCADDRVSEVAGQNGPR